MSSNDLPAPAWRWPALTVVLMSIALSACSTPANAKTPSPGSTYDNSLTFDGLSRTYRVHLPTSYSKSSPAPLMLSFHGRAGQGKGQEKLTNFDALSDQKGFVVVYPDGLYRSWNAGVGAGPAESRDIDDVGFVSALIDKLSKELAIDRGRIYASGMSNGGILTQRLGCELSGKLAAIASVAGPMGSKIAANCKPSRPVPVLEMHGTADPIVHMDGTFAQGPGRTLSVDETIAGWVARNGCATKPRLSDLGGGVSSEAYGSCKEGAEVILYRIDGAGHTWAGGWQYLPAVIVGPTNRQIDASKIIWEFVSKYRLNGTPANA